MKNNVNGLMRLRATVVRLTWLIWIDLIRCTLRRKSDGDHQMRSWPNFHLHTLRLACVRIWKDHFASFCRDLERDCPYFELGFLPRKKSAATISRENLGKPVSFSSPIFYSGSALKASVGDTFGAGTESIPNLGSRSSNFSARFGRIAQFFVF